MLRTLGLEPVPRYSRMRRFRVPGSVPGDVPHVGVAGRAGAQAGAARAPRAAAPARPALHARPAHARRGRPHVSADTHTHAHTGNASVTCY